MVASSRLTFCMVASVRLVTLTSSTMSYWCTAGAGAGGGGRGGPRAAARGGGGRGARRQGMTL